MAYLVQLLSTRPNAERLNGEGRAEHHSHPIVPHVDVVWRLIRRLPGDDDPDAGVIRLLAQVVRVDLHHHPKLGEGRLDPQFRAVLRWEIRRATAASQGRRMMKR